MGLLRTGSEDTKARLHRGRHAPGFAAAELPLTPAGALGRAGLVWAHPASGLSAEAFGEADRREGTLHDVLEGLTAPLSPEMPGPWFGAAAFDGSVGPEWSGFAPVRFVLPELLVWRAAGRQFAAAFGDRAQARLDDARRQLDLVNSVHLSDTPVNIVHRARRVARPGERARWDALVARALEAISSGSLDKVVLARMLAVESDAPIDPDALLLALQARHPACRSFLVRGDGGVFLGATPELLCRIDGGEITTEALAGSAAPGEATALLGSKKDLREHRWVVDHIVRALGQVATSVQRRPEPGLRRLANVVHLETPISARLAPGRTVADVVAALHPTPAVGGVPTAAAQRFLAAHEGLDRGLYAGLIGWAGPDRAELAVALRSALVRGKQARLFAGAGIVEGSSAAAEWNETELKARALLDALGAES